MKTNQRATPHSHHLVIRDALPIDGDTIVGMVEIGLDVYLKCKLRLKAFYAPEHDGQCPEAADRAQRKLYDATLNHTLTFPLRGAKKDRYGRWTVELWIDGHPANPVEILGPHQLSEEEHREDLRFAKNRKGAAIVV